jgi:hypothetical protein
LAQNPNPDFNAVQVHAIMETIQRMAPDGSPLVVLARQRAEAVNLIVPAKSTDVPWREPSIGGNDRTRHARSEAASSQVQIVICLSMTCDGASLRAMPPKNTSVNEMTSATLLKIGGVSGAELHPHRDGL